jgi:hypothetical protein
MNTGCNVLKPAVLLFILIVFITGVAACSGQDTPSATEPVNTISPESTDTSTQEGTTSAVVEWLADGIIMPGEYSGSNSYGGYKIHWSSDDQFIYIGIKADTSGWVSMAFQPGSRMKDADMVFGFVVDGQAQVIDLYSTGDFGPHVADTELGGTEDILSYGGKEEDGATTIEFKRALNTGDEYDIPVKKGVNKIIWAYGSDDGMAIKHAFRGYGELNH